MAQVLSIPPGYAQRPDREALEVPGDVLTEVDHPSLLAKPLGEQTGVAAHRRGNLVEPR